MAKNKPTDPPAATPERIEQAQQEAAAAQPSIDAAVDRVRRTGDAADEPGGIEGPSDIRETGSTTAQIDSSPPSPALADAGTKVIDGLWALNGSGYSSWIEADSRELAVALAKAYTGMEEQDFIVVQSKVRPPYGDPVLRGEIVKGTQMVDGKATEIDAVQYERGKYEPTRRVEPK